MPNNTVIEELRLEHITKRFPGVLACDDISLSVGKHEVLALVGENGAGKTTLMNIVSLLIPVVIIIFGAVHS